MATLIDTIQPSEEYLVGLLETARGDLSEDEWVTRAVTSIIENLKRDPRLFAAYGPWWPAVKEAIIRNGETSFGILNAPDVFAIYQMSTSALSILAAILYSGERTENGMIYSKEHLLEVNESADDTEPYYYLSDDPQLDRLIQQQGNISGSTNQTP